MNNLEKKINALKITVYILLMISILNLLIFIYQPFQDVQIEFDIWQENMQNMWTEKLQKKLNKIKFNINVLKKKNLKLQQEIFLNQDIFGNLRNSVENNISAILKSFDFKKRKWKKLNKKLIILEKDVGRAE